MNRRQHRTEPAAKCTRVAIMRGRSGLVVGGGRTAWSAVGVDGTVSWCGGGQAAELEAAHQIVREGKPQHHGAGFVQAADAKLLQATVTGNRVNAFGRGGPQLVEGLSGVGAHALTPRRDRGTIVRPREIRIPPRSRGGRFRLPGLRYRRIHDTASGGEEVERLVAG